ncbi:MAG: carboxypeptidase-like regulatory domain-containing protein [Mucilaginibacter sp.]
MSKPVNDISQIEKYLAGELDTRAMHDLERRALDDPFLADAIEGYQQAKSKQRKNLAELSGRLQNRTDRKVLVMTPRIQLSIAASILVIIGVGAWLVLRNQPEKQTQQVAANMNKAEKPQQPTISMPSNAAPQKADTFVKNKAGSLARVSPPALSSQSNAAQADDAPVISAPVTRADSESFANVTVQKNVAASKDEKASADINKSAASVQYKASTQNANDVIVQGLSDKKLVAKKASQGPPETQLVVPKADMNLNPAHSGNNTLIGYVTANNQPIMGAIVKLAGRDFGVVTDANGRFVMHDVPDNKSLVVKSLGYSTKQVKVNGSDSVNVSLEPVGNALSEVVVASPSAKSDNSPGSTHAHPVTGWKALDDYLKKNGVSPDGQTGKVKLSFMVDGRGALSGFKVIQSLSPAADQKAIDLITNGPAWAGNIDGQPHEVKLTVKFH